GVQHIGFEPRRRALRARHIGPLAARTGKRQQGDQYGASHASPPQGCGWSETGGGKTGAAARKAEPQSRVAKTHHRTGLRLLYQWNVTPNPKSTTSCFQPVANGAPPPDTLKPPTAPYAKLALVVSEPLGPTRTQ